MCVAVCGRHRNGVIVYFTIMTFTFFLLVSGLYARVAVASATRAEEQRMTWTDTIELGAPRSPSLFECNYSDDQMRWAVGNLVQISQLSQDYSVWTYHASIVFNNTNMMRPQYGCNSSLDLPHYAAQ